MLSRLFTVALFYLSIFGFAQAFENFPPMQESYEGGKVQFYKDLHQVFVDQKLKPCENSKELYSLSLIIYPDRKIKFVKDFDSVNVMKNKCAFDLARSGVKYLKGWKPAIIDGREAPAIASYWIVPDFLFDKYVEGYEPFNNSTAAEYKGGVQKFRRDIASSVDLSRFSFTSTVRVEIRFVVDVDGKVDDIQFERSSGLVAFDDMLAETIRRLKKWKPATISGIPVRTHYKLPLTFAPN